MEKFENSGKVIYERYCISLDAEQSDHFMKNYFPLIVMSSRKKNGFRVFYYIVVTDVSSDIVTLESDALFEPYLLNRQL